LAQSLLHELICLGVGHHLLRKVFADEIVLLRVHLHLLHDSLLRVWRHCPPILVSCALGPLRAADMEAEHLLLSVQDFLVVTFLLVVGPLVLCVSGVHLCVHIVCLVTAWGWVGSRHPVLVLDNIWVEIGPLLSFLSYWSCYMLLLLCYLRLLLMRVLLLR
jgi:hypothetical protein